MSVTDDNLAPEDPKGFCREYVLGVLGLEARRAFRDAACLREPALTRKLRPGRNPGVGLLQM